MKSLKLGSAIAAIVIVLGPPVAMAGAAGNVSREAQKLEKRVQKDASSGWVSQDDADRYTQELDHIIASMTQQNSTTALRKGMRTSMDRIEKALDAAEQAGTGAAPAATPTP